MFGKELTALHVFRRRCAIQRTRSFPAEGREVPETLLNDTVRLFASHRSIRSYKPEPLPDGALEVIVAAAQSASTSHNFQAYSIIAVQDADRKHFSQN